MSVDPDFGKTASDYSRYRAGFPAAFFQRLFAMGVVASGQRVLDLGTGTGTVARGLAQRGCRVTGLDKSASMLAEAKRLDAEASASIEYVLGLAEETGLGAGSFHVVTTGQCWHWFDRPRATAEALRLLVPGGRLVIAHFDWLPMPGNVVEATEDLILKYNRRWNMGRGLGVYPLWLRDVGVAGFQDIESFTFDESVPYSHEAWRGRIRASSGVAGSLTPKKVERFDEQHRRLLEERSPHGPLDIPHRVFVCVSRAPGML